MFREGVDDLGVPDVIEEHAVDHVAFEDWEAGDFAVAADFPSSGRETDARLGARGQRLTQGNGRLRFSGYAGGGGWKDLESQGVRLLGLVGQNGFDLSL